MKVRIQKFSFCWAFGVAFLGLISFLLTGALIFAAIGPEGFAQEVDGNDRIEIKKDAEVEVTIYRRPQPDTFEMRLQSLDGVRVQYIFKLLPDEDPELEECYFSDNAHPRRKLEVTDDLRLGFKKISDQLRKKLKDAMEHKPEA